MLWLEPMATLFEIVPSKTLKPNETISNLWFMEEIGKKYLPYLGKKLFAMRTMYKAFKAQLKLLYKELKMM